MGIKLRIFSILTFLWIAIPLIGASALAYTLSIDCGDNGILNSLALPSDLTGFAWKAQIGSFDGRVQETSAKAGCPNTGLSPSFEGGADSQGMLIVDEVNSLVRSRSSHHYDSAKIENIIELALQNAVDPYAALAISLIEEPPFKLKTIQPKVPVTASSIGKPELTSAKWNRAIAVLDDPTFLNMLGCDIRSDWKNLAKNPDSLGLSSAEVSHYANEFEKLAKLKDQWSFLTKTKHGEDQQDASVALGLRLRIDAIVDDLRRLRESSPDEYEIARCSVKDIGCKGVLSQPASRVQSFDFSTSGLSAKQGEGSSQVDACWSAPNLDAIQFVPRADGVGTPGRSCCVHLNIPVSQIKETKGSDKSLQVNDDVYTALWNKVVMQTIKKKTDFNRCPTAATGLARMAQDLQGFNGYETVKFRPDPCLYGMNMCKTPVYGAEVGDIMLNMLLVNPEIEKMVNEARQRTDKPQQSLFCAKEGKGKHQIDSNAFVELEKQFTSARPACTTGSPGQPPIRFTDWQNCSDFEKATGVNCRRYTGRR